MMKKQHGILMAACWALLSAGAEQCEIPVTVANRTAVDWSAGETAVIGLGRLPVPGSFAPAALTVTVGGETVPSQYDDLNFSGTADAADEICFRLPAIPRGGAVQAVIRFGSLTTEKSEAAFMLKKLGTFIKAECGFFTAVFDRESGTLNTVYLNEPRQVLCKSVLHSALYSFVGGFYSPDAGKTVWKDRLMSWEFSGKLKGFSAGPVRAVVAFDDIGLRNRTGALDFDDRYAITSFLYPEGRIVERFTIDPGKKQDSACQLVFRHLPPALPEQTPFRRLTAYDAAGKPLQSVEIPERGEFRYARPAGAVLAGIGVEADSCGVSFLVNPGSFEFRRNVRNSTDSAAGWNYNGSYREAQSAFRSDPWSGEEFNIGMCASEWPSRLAAGEAALESCVYLWRDKNRTGYVAGVLQGGPLAAESITVNQP